MKLPYVVVALAMVGACKSKGKTPSELWPVGLELGVACTYSAPAAVAKLHDGGKGGSLIGAGLLTENCGGTERTIEVVEPTGIEIVGPDSVKVGEINASAKTYSLKILGDKKISGTRVLTGLDASGSRPGWWLDSDCGDTRLEVPHTAPGTTPSNDRTLYAIASGPCTIQAQLFSMTTKRTVTIK